MRQVLTRLYWGNFDDALNLDELKKVGITHIVNCAFEVDHDYSKEELEPLKLNLVDGEPIPVDVLEKAIDFIVIGIARGKVFVHCNAGVSRSATIVLAYLIKIGFNRQSAMDLLPGAMPSIAAEDSINRYFGILYTEN